MSRGLYTFINVLIYWALVTGLDVLAPGSTGKVFALLIGGILFALLAIAVEPVLGFFKFPTNFWGLLVVGFLLNLIFFIVVSTGMLPGLVTIKVGSLGQEFAPLPFPIFALTSTLIAAVVVSLIASLLQILVRKIGK